MSAEVTVAQWLECVEAGRCSSTNARDFSRWHQCNIGADGRTTHPLNCLNFVGALEVCAFLGGRVPTREEWLAVATAGGTRPWPWGEEPPSRERVQFVDGGVEDVQATTAPVCSTPRARTGAGLCDVVGNVSEWTQTVVDVPHDERAFRVVNGGSAWAYTVEQLRPSETSIVAETSSAHGIGVRCVRKSDIR
jgi:formylglycine-generating enzyme required for sulfatase activity